MRSITLLAFLLPSMILATQSTADIDVSSTIVDSNEATALPRSTSYQLTSPVSNPNTVPTSISSSSLPVEKTPSLHFNDLELRQAGVGAAGGTQNSIPAPTQMSPITTYLIHGANGAEIPVPYTQLFSKVPDQWSGPTSGAIGLGNITGVVGVVKTNAKRNVWATAEAMVGRALLERRSNDATSAAVSGWMVCLGSVGIAGLVGVL